MAQSVIDTDRLILRRWNDADLVPYAEICADPNVMKFIANGSVLTSTQTRDEIHQMELTWEVRGFGTYAVESRATGELLGSVGFSWHDFLPRVSPCVQIGWRLATSAWNTGYATEAARAALERRKNNSDLARIYCFCQTENQASQRIAAKIDLIPVDRVISPTYQREIIVYRTADDERFAEPESF